MTELDKLHRNFYRTKLDRLYALLSQAKDPNATPETHSQIETLSASCDVFQSQFGEPSRFRVPLPQDDIVFNRSVLLDCGICIGGRFFTSSTKSLTSAPLYSCAKAR